MTECFGPGHGTRPTVYPQAGRQEFCQALARRGARRGVEVGVWTGKFAEQLCQTIPGLRLTCVDPWHPYADYRERKNDAIRLQAAYEETLARLRPYPCTILRMTSLEAAARVADGSMDFVYLDGNHAKAYVLQDVAAWLPKLRVGGILAGHDYRRHPGKPFIEVADAIDDYTAAHGIAEWFVLAAEAKAPTFGWVV